MNKYIYMLTVLSIATTTGCKKERSFETGERNPFFIGTNCRISQVVRADTASGKALEAHTAFFTPSLQPTATEFYDSSGNSVLFRSDFLIRKDTLQVTNASFFLLDNNSRVKEFSGLEDPTDPFSDRIRIVFTYNTEGYLTQQDYYYFGLTVPLLRSTYSYAGGNLIKSALSSLFPSPELLTESTLEYNNQPVNGFFYLFTDAYLTYPYHLSVNLGKRPPNTVKKITTKLFSGSTVVESYITDYKNYQLSTDRYVLQLFADGDYQAGLGIIHGRTKLRYSCP